MTKEQVINYLKAHKKEFQKRYGIVTLGLFGSYAKESATSNSDIDIFYERDRDFKLQSGLEFLALADKIAKDLNVSRVDLVKLSSINPIVKYDAEEDFIYV